MVSETSIRALTIPSVWTSAYMLSLLLILQAAPTVTKSINETASFSNYYPMSTSIDVKRNNVNKDPATQLATRVAAEFRKRRLEG